MADNNKVSYDDLLQSGAHFGHRTSKWHPKMAPYIFMERNEIHIIDLNKTLKMLEEACSVTKQLASSGRKILFVATKKQAREIVQSYSKKVNMPFVTERWLGGMLTNFATVRKSIKNMIALEKMETDGTFETLNKKERLMKMRERTKLESVLGGIAQLSRLPSALFIIDIKKEHIAVKEARILNIPTIAIVDTNSDPNQVDFAIPANDDAAKSIELIMKAITNSITEGNQERKAKRSEENKGKEEKAATTEAPVKE